MEYILTNGENCVTVFGTTAPRYIRTDKNGTKVFHDVNCPRCAGAGRSDNWWATGYECYACGGTGRRSKPQEVKVYTVDYLAVMEARRAAKAAQQPKTSEDDLVARAREARSNAWQNHGFSRDGVGFLYTGNTYSVKNRLSKAGGRWCGALKGWIAPVELDGIKGTKIEKIKAEDFCDGRGDIDPEKCWDR